MHVAWKGGDVVRFPGGGHKINMLRPVIEQWREEEDMVIMFVDRYVQGVPITAGSCMCGCAVMMWCSLWELMIYCKSSETLTANWSFLLNHFAGQMCR